VILKNKIRLAKTRPIWYILIEAAITQVVKEGLQLRDLKRTAVSTALISGSGGLPLELGRAAA
jgi:hypothetical protein